MWGWRFIKNRCAQIRIMGTIYRHFRVFHVCSTRCVEFQYFKMITTQAGQAYKCTNCCTRSLMHASCAHSDVRSLEDSDSLHVPQWDCANYRIRVVLTSANWIVFSILLVASSTVITALYVLVGNTSELENVKR